jgi:DNA replication protein
MKAFSGFPDSELKMSALPEMFYTGLLPLIDDMLELKVTLACFRLCWQKTGLVHWTTRAELLHDPALSDVQASLPEGIAKAIRRGSLVGALDRSGLQYLFPNSELGRAAAKAIARGEKIEQIVQLPTRPNIFALYEQNIGALTPLIAEQLTDAEQEFPPQWIAEAFAEAVKQNARSWAYVKKILDNRARGAKRETSGQDFTADKQRYAERRRHDKS